MKRLRWLLLLAIFIANAASALAAIEFLRMEDASDKANFLKPIIVSFVSRGYKKVPDWPSLSNECRKLILEKGYTFQNMEQVAEEAAIRLGMSR